MKNKIINKKNNTVFRKFSKEEHGIWKILCEKRLKKLKNLASPLHQKGWDLLEMSIEEIPDFDKLNTKLKSLTGWQVASTGIQYEEDETWLSSLNQKVIKITEFIREKNSLDYTPLPDIFHDAFGHLPFLADPDYARIAEKFGIAYSKARTQKQKDSIAENWWYGIEFSLIKDGNNIKALGTGLISSEGELGNALSDKVNKLPYNWDTISKIKRSAHEFHNTLFVLESLNQLEDAINKLL